jgi:hypothetical protein
MRLPPDRPSSLRVLSGAQVWPGEHPDHCAYGERTQPPSPECPNRAIYHVQGWGGQDGAGQDGVDLCQDHHDQILASGALIESYRYTAEELAANAEDAAVEYRFMHRMASRHAPQSTRADLRLLRTDEVE